MVCGVDRLYVEEETLYAWRQGVPVGCRMCSARPIRDIKKNQPKIIETEKYDIMSS